MATDRVQQSNFNGENNITSTKFSSCSVDERARLLGGTSASRSASDLEHGRVRAYPHARDYSDMFSSLILPTAKSNVSVGGDDSDGTKDRSHQKSNRIFLILIYGMINTIMCVPCLYGYAAVIFNNSAFQPDINALSKLVLFSSVIHQICFSIFSSLPFSIGQVQDAGLIFLSVMANKIANSMSNDATITREEIVSTTVVVLGVATSCLGVILVLMGKFRMADLVSYLPLPVVGGYLGFIGYFCVMAGVSLCIDEAMIVPSDWAYLLNVELLTLAIPGLISGLCMVLISRRSTNDTNLPMFMVALPAMFYVFLYVTGYGTERARNDGWLGPVSQPIPPQSVFALIKLNQVHWSVLRDILPTWAGMVFVVSFSSCLDVAAISMDMGEALDVNNELMTVGISNCFSGIMCGFTGSYIFSQTIFTYRTGIKSRWIGIFVGAAELTVFVLTFNVLEVTPLFFLGGTLIFIGFELLYEWLVEVRHKLLLSEYCVLMATFILIFFLSIDEGIVFGILIAGLDYVVKTARTVSLTQLEKRSRAVWNRDEWKFLQLHCYDPRNPKIMTLEVKGSVFFGSSLQLLNQMIQLTGVKKRSENSFKDTATQNPFRSPRRSSPASIKDRRTSNNSPNAIKTVGGSYGISETQVVSPEIVILHLSLMQNLDASAAQGCFLQFARMCGKHGVVVCASGASVRVDWMLRAHHVAYNLGEEDYLKERLLGSMSSIAALDLTKIILFETIYEALEFAEACLLGRARCYTPYINLMGSSTPSNYPSTLLSQYTLSAVFNQYLGLEEKETQLLEQFESDGGKFHEDMRLSSGDSIFSEGEPADAFYIILAGSVALHQAGSVALKQRTTARSPKSLKRTPKKSLSVPERGGILSGAGFLPLSKRHSFEEKAEDLGLVNQYLQAGAIFGFVDFILDQPRRFGAVVKGKAVVAQISRGDLTNLKAENPELQRIVDKVLLQASIRELSAISEP